VYVRLARLWGDHGQSCLELAKVCLINATATGTEILKNLILPGIVLHVLPTDTHSFSLFLFTVHAVAADCIVFVRVFFLYAR